jgi:uncharacterized protein YodC (DUF2158 family)
MKKLNLKVGDVVRLKCGSPNMVVDAVRTDRHGVECVHTTWYEGNKEMRYAHLPMAVFVKVPDGQA